MRTTMLFLLILFGTGCRKDNPLTAENRFLPELPSVVVTESNYTESDIQNRVPDTTFLNKCCATYKNNFTDSVKRYTTEVLLQKAALLGQDTSVVSACLRGTGQLNPGAVSVLYIAERAKFRSNDCWIFEFAWGVNAGDLEHYRCFVMDIATRDTLLFITCK